MTISASPACFFAVLDLCIATPSVSAITEHTLFCHSVAYSLGRVRESTPWVTRYATIMGLFVILCFC